MSSWLESITGPLTAASQTVQKAIEIRDSIKFGEEVGKLHSQILAAMTGAIAAKSNEAALLDEIGGLKKKVAELEQWNAEKERYELCQLAPHVLAYAIKPSARGAEPDHYICANCYNKGEKRFLNRTIHHEELDR